MKKGNFDSEFNVGVPSIDQFESISKDTWINFILFNLISKADNSTAFVSLIKALETVVFGKNPPEDYKNEIILKEEDLKQKYGTENRDYMMELSQFKFSMLMGHIENKIPILESPLKIWEDFHADTEESDN